MRAREQIEAFPSHERFVHALLGLLSACDDCLEAVTCEPAGEVQCEDGPGVDFALGLVSFARTLKATLEPAAQTQEPARDAVEQQEPEVVGQRGLLR